MTLVFAAFGAAGVEALRRQTAREFPTATPLGMRDVARGRARSMRESAQQVRRAVARLASEDDARLGRLERLAALREKGALTDDEFAAEKARVLANGSADGGSEAPTVAVGSTGQSGEPPASPPASPPESDPGSPNDPASGSPEPKRESPAD
jgi:hypothetical protein